MFGQTRTSYNKGSGRAVRRSIVFKPLLLGVLICNSGL